MPERSSKRKARRDSPVNSLDEPESSSMRTENAASLSDRDFTELSEKIEKSVSKRIKDAEVGQREILKMIENLTYKIDTLTERPPNNVRHDPHDEDAENTDYRYRPVESSDLLPNHGQHIFIFKKKNKMKQNMSKLPLNILSIMVQHKIAIRHLIKQTGSF